MDRQRQETFTEHVLAFLERRDTMNTVTTMRTITADFNLRDVLVVIKHLAEHSIYFEFTPLPDGRYEIKAKEEQTALLASLVQGANWEQVVYHDNIPAHLTEVITDAARKTGLTYCSRCHNWFEHIGLRLWTDLAREADGK